MFRFFVDKYNPKSIISYCDIRWCDYHYLEPLDFHLHHKSSPSYWYFKHDLYVLESKLNFQKHKLKNILPHYDDSKTEYENMCDNDYYRIYDCGCFVMVWNQASDSATSATDAP